MEFYPLSDCWLFGGVFKVLERSNAKYAIEEVPAFEKYEGRLLLSFHRYQGLRGRAFKLENHIANLEVTELLPKRYSGEAFCGYENINHDFHVLEAIFRVQRPDWRAALGNLKGVYLICDKSNGRKYVGSASGGEGIWARWACYLGTGHGGNDELVSLIQEKKIDYARSNFTFSLLEIMTPTTPDEVVLRRESHWKRVLLTRTHGYNRN
jgi:hypothetical protein